ncbi:MAG: PspA/IM30 family protein [Crocinitomicaceae bacterium]|nr:PspA/IM30 family protein [Flavobacteriales bacterium]NQZ35281.1 PspA/IM30 family protein [Crocinitomicaceae bacterium]PHR17004.1 MAG: phage shock protein A [Fluviicola sp.]
MWAWLKRLFRIGKAEAHSALDKLENPVKMTEQGIRDLKVNLEKALVAMAEVKAMGIRSKGEVENYEAKAADYETKATLLLKKAAAGEMDAADADRLAAESLLKKQENEAHAALARKNQTYFESSSDKLGSNIDGLKKNISKYENELKTLKARAKVSAAQKEINKDLAGIDSDSTVAMLEKMKEKVAQEEALAESYGDMASESRSLDDEINDALDSSSAELKMKSDLDALKAKISSN